MRSAVCARVALTKGHMAVHYHVELTDYVKSDKLMMINDEMFWSMSLDESGMVQSNVGPRGSQEKGVRGVVMS